MKKLLMIIFSVMMIFILTGCKTGNSTSNPGAATPSTPLGTNTPTKANEEVDNILLQPGFETWGKSKAVNMRLVKF